VAQYQDTLPTGAQRTYAGERTPSAWTFGLVTFAAVMLTMLGFFHAIAGFAAILDDTFYVVRSGYDLEVDVTTWGWIHLGGGVIVGLAGIALFTGALWARIIGITVALISAVWSFYSIPYYPVWSIVLIALDIGVIWALAAHGRDFTLAD
jgi:hypothetical protein